MKTRSALHIVWLTVIAAFFTLSNPAFAVSHALMLQAQDLVHQAWNPGGSPPSDAQRVHLLKSALTLLHDDPYRGYEGHRGKAIRYIHSALDEIKIGDPDNKVDDYLQDAVDQLRSAIVDNED